MALPLRVVVVGSSVAGVRCVQALRAEGFRGQLVLAGEEKEPPYDKPPLSKQFLAGIRGTEQLRLLTHEAAVELDVELRLGSAAEGLDVIGKQLFLADGSVLDYDVVVLATGAAARPSPWALESGVHVIRTLADAAGLRAALSVDAPVVVVGGGFIGAEAAATAHAMGRDVTVVDPMTAPIARVLGEGLGAHFAELHPRHGVRTRFGVGVTSVSGRAGDLTVTLGDGTELSAGTVVVGIGAVPNDAWLRSSGLAVDDGVLCDEHCRAVGVEDVFVIGDLARSYHPGSGVHLRVEHWTNAVDSAVVAAHNIAHPDEQRLHTATEYVWSDQYDWKIQIVGRPAAATRYEIIGSFEGAAARGIALCTDDTGALLGAVAVNWPRALMTARRLTGTGATFVEALTQVSSLSPAKVST